MCPINSTALNNRSVVPSAEWESMARTRELTVLCVLVLTAPFPPVPGKAAACPSLSSAPVADGRSTAGSLSSRSAVGNGSGPPGVPQPDPLTARPARPTEGLAPWGAGRLLRPRHRPGRSRSARRGAGGPCRTAPSHLGAAELPPENAGAKGKGGERKRLPAPRGAARAHSRPAAPPALGRSRQRKTRTGAAGGAATAAGRRGAAEHRYPLCPHSRGGKRRPPQP